MKIEIRYILTTEGTETRRIDASIRLLYSVSFVALKRLGESDFYINN